MDNLFKALLIIILGAFLYLYYENTESGRYINVSGIRILDTKTGKVFVYNEYGGTLKVIDILNAPTEDKKLSWEQKYKERGEKYKW